MNVNQPVDGRRSGFTLLELLIAVAVFAVVLAAVNAVFYSALRLRNSTTAMLEEALPVHRAVAIIRRDLAGLAPPGRVLGGELQTMVSSGNLVGQVGPDFHTAGAVIDDYLPWGEVQRVSYLLVEAEEGNGHDLVRVVTRNLLPVMAEEPEEYLWLLSNVQAVEFLFFDGMQWVDFWDSTAEPGGLPRGVKVRIYRGESAAQAQEAPIEIVAPISVQAPANAEAPTSGGML